MSTENFVTRRHRYGRNYVSARTFILKFFFTFSLIKPTCSHYYDFKQSFLDGNFFSRLCFTYGYGNNAWTKNWNIPLYHNNIENNILKLSPGGAFADLFLILVLPIHIQEYKTHPQWKFLSELTYGPTIGKILCPIYKAIKSGNFVVSIYFLNTVKIYLKSSYRISWREVN